MKKLLAAALMLVSSFAFGQRYTVVSASSGGDIGDMIQRTALAGVEFVAEYSPGGDGLIAPSKFAAKPPGHYLLMSGLMTQQVVGPKLHPGRAAYTDADLVPVTLLAQTYFVVLAHHKAVFPRGRIAVAGSNSQMIARLLGLEHVAYKGILQGVVDVGRGELEFALIQVGPAQPHLQSGRVRQVAAFPEIPAAFGLYGQRTMSAGEVATLAQAVVHALSSQTAREAYARNHLQVPAEFGPSALVRFVAAQRRDFAPALEP